MFRTSRPCAVTTSGASTSEANRPAGTRKCAHTTSGRAALRTRRRSSRNRAFPPARRSSTASSISWPRSRSARSPCATKAPRSGSSGPGYIWETSRIRIAVSAARVRGRARPTRRAGRRRSRRSCSARAARRASGRAGSRVPRPRRARAASADAASSALRSARSAAVRSSWRRSASGSIACSSIGCSDSATYSLTPTITRSPDSTSCCHRNAAVSISPCTKPCSTALTAPPSSSMRSISSHARASSSSVSASM